MATDEEMVEAVDRGEMVEEVDRDGTVLQVVSRARMRAERLRHRSVFVAVLDRRGRLLVHRRSPDKDLWPGRWDVAVGGVLGVGEPWDSGAARELGEELGVHAPLEPLGGGVYEDRDVRLVARCYAARHDGPFHFDDGEIVATEWMDAESLMVDLGRREYLPDSVALILPRLGGFRAAMP